MRQQKFHFASDVMGIFSGRNFTIVNFKNSFLIKLSSDSLFEKY